VFAAALFPITKAANISRVGRALQEEKNTNRLDMPGFVLWTTLRETAGGGSAVATCSLPFRRIPIFYSLLSPPVNQKRKVTPWSGGKNGEHVGPHEQPFCLELTPRQLLSSHLLVSIALALTSNDSSFKQNGQWISLLLEGRREEIRVPMGGGTCMNKLLGTTVDLDLGSAKELTLSDGTTAAVRILGMDVRTDSIRGAVRHASVVVDVNGERARLTSNAYTLPSDVGGVQIDCPAVGALQRKCQDVWGLDHDVRLRLWPAGSPWIEPGTFRYPAVQRWFATDTQMCNAPCFVGGAEYVGMDRIYYHYGQDIGGSEGDTEVIASTAGRVVCSGEAFDETRKDEYELDPRYDRVHILDDRGWVHLYSHLKEIDAAVRVGETVALGQRVGLLGKEGSSGGWAHLHFGIKCRQPSGRLGAEEAYPCLWQAYVAEYSPDIIAVARPHHLVRIGESVELDGRRSWARDPDGITSWTWLFHDGTTASSPRAQRAYDTAGIYSEILTVRDAQGHEAVDFAVVQVIDRYEADGFPPGIHAAYAPTFDIRPGTPLRFRVRSFMVAPGEETWDFGDGSPRVTVHSSPMQLGGENKHSLGGYAVTEHAYSLAGRYIATVERVGSNGLRATARVCVDVEPEGK